MDYELAKELKEAGFLRARRGRGPYLVFLAAKTIFDPKAKRWHHRQAHWKLVYTHSPETQWPNNEWLLSPTLEELIEACGDKLQALYKGRACWIATEQNPLLNDWYNFTGFHCDGLTPSEAVAKLWLELNKKTASEEAA